MLSLPLLSFFIYFDMLGTVGCLWSRIIMRWWIFVFVRPKLLRHERRKGIRRVKFRFHCLSVAYYINFSSLLKEIFIDYRNVIALKRGCKSIRYAYTESINLSAFWSIVDDDRNDALLNICLPCFIVMRTRETRGRPWRTWKREKYGHYKIRMCRWCILES